MWSASSTSEYTGNSESDFSKLESGGGNMESACLTTCSRPFLAHSSNGVSQKSPCIHPKIAVSVSLTFKPIIFLDRIPQSVQMPEHVEPLLPPDCIRIAVPWHTILHSPLVQVLPRTGNHPEHLCIVFVY